MRLELHTPPRLVAVVDDGRTRPALLLASRGDRRYVQVSRGPGLNSLRWVPAASVGAAVAAPAPAEPGTTALPWIRSRSDR